VEDALNATRAAVEEGIVPGGGVALIRALKAIEKMKLDVEDQQIGVNIIRRSLEEPLRQIANNAGKEGSVIVQRVKGEKDDFGYDAGKDEFTKMIDAGIIDPTKVVRTALQNAASVASLMITTEAMIAEKPEEKKPMAGMPPGGGMEGMY
jgi:chaperonin GroEL